MNFDPALTEGCLLRRYKRFLADVRLPDGEVVTAHCPNPGSMLSLIGDNENAQRVYLSHSSDPRRKLAWTLELLDVAGTLVCVNTQRPNRVVEEAVGNGDIADLSGYASIRREVAYGARSRIDLLLQGDSRSDCYVEIKSVTMSREKGLIEFPDSVTARGRKHLGDLSEVAMRGDRAVLFLLSPRADGERFRVASDIDPAYAKAFQSAIAAGVEVMARACAVSPTGLYPSHPVEVELE